MPTMYLLPQTDTFVYQFKPCRNYSRRSRMLAGRTCNGSLSYLLLRFGLRRALPVGASLVSASLLLTVTKSFSREPTPEYAVLRILSRWSSARVNWRSRPIYDPTPAATFVSPVVGTENIDVTSLVQSWLSGEDTNLGLLIKGIGSRCRRTFFTVSTVNSLNSDNWPRLMLQYVLPSVVVSPEFINIYRNLNVPSGGSTNEVQDVSLLGLVTVSVTNNGPDSVNVHLEISTDGINYVQSGSTRTIVNRATVNLIADTFVRYLKVVIVDVSVNGADVDVYYQGQIG